MKQVASVDVETGKRHPTPAATPPPRLPPISWAETTIAPVKSFAARAGRISIRGEPGWLFPAAFAGAPPERFVPQTIFAIPDRAGPVPAPRRTAGRTHPLRPADTLAGSIWLPGCSW